MNKGDKFLESDPQTESLGIFPSGWEERHLMTLSLQQWKLLPESRAVSLCPPRALHRAGHPAPLEGICSLLQRLGQVPTE